jgi:enoyl-CoA hydratase/carnithine racemase
MSPATITTDLAGEVLTITLNRPDKLNALSLDLTTELDDALHEADRNPDVRVVILTGAGRAFSAGFELYTDGSPDRDEDAATLIKQNQLSDRDERERIMFLWRMRVPVIAAVNGWCLGGGFWYQLAADISIAADDAVFGQPEVRDVMGTSYLFVHLAGWKAANRYALTGDHFDAAEALRMGVVSEVVPAADLLPTARRLAERIAAVPEPAVRLNKAMAMLGLEASGVHSGVIVNHAFAALVHSSYGEDRERLDNVMREEGFGAYLKARDGKFRPEPFGPRARRDPDGRK